MSAIAGLWRFDGRPDAEAECHRMLQAQRIYGPHATAAAGELRGALAIGRNLYRLLPEDAFDRQPLVGPQWTVAADLRLDNRAELSQALGVRDAPEMSDADLLARAIHRWGAGACERLYGEFALAAFDRQARRLLLARCPAGLRPLHYHEGDGLFAFASMPKGLHALAEVPRAPDQEAIALGLGWHVRPAGRCFFEGVRRLEPGMRLEVDADGKVQIGRWWSPPRGPLRLKRDEEYVEAARAELDGAVRRSLRGARHVAAHLSSGFDSAGVAATAARLLAPEAGTVTGFTAAPRDGYSGPLPPGSIGDESQLAALAAAMHSNIEPVVVRPPTGSYLPELDRYVFLHEQPAISLPNQVWIDAIYDQARARGLSVLLSAEMGNLGLTHHGLELLPQLLRRGRLKRLAGAVRSLKCSGHRRYRASAALTLGPYMPLWLWRGVSATLRGRDWRATRHSAIRPEFIGPLEPLARQIPLGPDSRPPKDTFDLRIAVFQRVDRGLIRKGVLAGWGIDQRDPTSDRRLMEFFLQMPPEGFLLDNVPRGLARAVLADRLPAELLDERRRGRQAVDWHEGVAADLPRLKEEIARIAACGPAAAIIDTQRLARMADAWPTAGFEGAGVMMSHRVALLRAVSTGHFMRRISGSNA